MMKITQIRSETPSIKTLCVASPQISNKASPGQFIMVWIPGIDEIPLSIAETEPDLSICIKDVGIATHALHNLAVGDRIGIRGPYGHGFSLQGTSPLIVGGGIGMAHFLYLIRELRKTANHITVINGARTKDELLFLSELKDMANASLECIFTTDDGSYGITGVAAKIAIQKAQTSNFDYVYTCGPELMMWSLFQATEQLKIPMEACLERYMKCGIGLCGTCSIDPLGYRVCIEGPVFHSTILRSLSDFGQFKRTSGGKKLKI